MQTPLEDELEGVPVDQGRVAESLKDELMFVTVHAQEIHLSPSSHSTSTDVGESNTPVAATSSSTRLPSQHPPLQFVDLSLLTWILTLAAYVIHLSSIWPAALVVYAIKLFLIWPWTLAAYTIKLSVIWPATVASYAIKSSLTWPKALAAYVMKRSLALIL